MPNEVTSDLQKLRREPRNFDALHHLGIARAQAGDFAAAVRHLTDAIEVNPRSAEVFLHLANVRMAVGEAQEALAAYERALVLKPKFPEALYGRGNALQALGRHAEAVASYDRVLVLVPDRPEALTHRGNSLHDLGRHEEALASYDRALTLLPGVAMLHNNRANTLWVLKRYEAALASLGKALDLEPGYVDALINRGNILQEIGRHDEALACFDKVLAIAPRHLPALNNRGNLLAALKRHEEAVTTVARLLEMAPDWDYAPGLLLQSQLRSCNWARYEQDAARVIQGVRNGKKADIPFSFLAVSGSATDQLLCAQTHAAAKYPQRSAPLWSGAQRRHERIRVAYISADFREHPVSYLLTGVFGAHDRRHFEVTGISLRPDDGSSASRRVRAALGNVVEVFRRTDADIAALLRELEIDIAVDLMGYTHGARSAIFAYRPAPVQVNYLGYPGTLGVPYMDYLIADRVVVPPGRQAHYSERIVWMPDCFQANDDQRRIGARPGRSAMGLPEAGFVFCCFNNSYKITPAMFERWLGLLRAVPGSVLWLVADHPAVPRNLREEARRRDVDPARLVFAERLPYADHLARVQLADLFLDTLPFNAGTTASDALWAGVPVLTCPGDAFASRMAASLLTAAGLPELIAGSVEDYSALALKLATTPPALAELRARLARNRSGCALFDTGRFCRNLESAYRTMWERFQRGEGPAGFEVKPG
jgi:protein O-GlcNAc transferase